MRRISTTGVSVDDLPILGRNEHKIFNQIIGQYDAPAYIRRARQVQDSHDLLIARCRKQREEWLPLVRTRLATLRALATDWWKLRPWLADEEQVQTLERLHADLEPRLRLPVTPTSSPRKLRGALRELIESLERFNRRWRAFLPSVDLSQVNDLRKGYNLYYILEKECAVRSARVARQGFRPVPPLTVEDLFAVLPPLPLPHLKG
jgi:hypothetical protein